jgi:hypothetical protein
VIPDRPDQVPDSIEPLIGYRAWRFSFGLHEASLFPLTGPVEPKVSPWDGATRRWVTASCRFGGLDPVTDPMREHLERIASKLGSQLDEVLRRDPHSIPGEGCSCGFYAMKTLGGMLSLSGTGFILGRVELAGKVIEYTEGYRAERARIVELIPSAPNDRSAMRLALQLGLPLAPPTPPWIHGLPPVA